MAFAVDILDWIAKASPLDAKKSGTRAKFSEDNSVVRRIVPEESGGDCVCYTRHPLTPGQVWQITKLTITWKWHYGFVSAFHMYV